MAGVQIFHVELTDRASGAHLTLAGGRQFDPQCFYLDFGDVTLRIWRDEAARFASAVRRLAWRHHVKRPGRVWHRELGDGAGLRLNVEFGLDEAGLAYVEVGSTKIGCDAAQTDDVLFFLGRFADDVSSLKARFGGTSPAHSSRV